MRIRPAKVGSPQQPAVGLAGEVNEENRALADPWLARIRLSAA